MKLRKACLAFAAAMMLALSLSALGGCAAQNDEQVIRDGLTEQFDQIKSLDEETLGSFSDIMGADAFEELGIDPIEFVRVFLSDFDYTINSVEVDGDTAEANITFTNKSINAFQESITAVVDEISSTEGFVDMDTEELASLYGDRVMEALESVPVASTDSVVITCVKTDNAWELDSSAFQSVFSALMGI